MAAHAVTPDDHGLSGWLRAQEQKDLVRFVTIGSVDDGKSTLIGRLLHDAQGLYQDQLDAVRRASVRGSTRGAGSTSEIDFSLFTDGLLAEREQGITIDVAYRYFATDKRKFIIADTPGHVQYTRNMATGASTADVAVVLVDARLGVVPQTRRHAHIAALLGIPNVIACVNKMDLVGFDEARFEAIVADLDAIARKVGLVSMRGIPVSALAGDNVVTPSTRMPWWQGGTMLGHLETVPVASAYRPASFRLPVQIVLRPSIGYRGFAGTIASGTVQTGDEVVVLPSGKRTRVIGVDRAGRDVGQASAPESVALRLADDIDVSRGDLLAHVADAPCGATEVDADLVWMSERPLDPARTYLLKHTTRSVRAEIEVVAGSDPETLEACAPHPLALNDIGRVRVRTRAPIFFDPYRDNRTTGAFVLVDSVTNDTVAAGMIVGLPAHEEGDVPGGSLGDARSQVSPAERRQRVGQLGAVVRVAGSLAFAVERELFDRGLVAAVLDEDEATSAAVLARSGIVAVVAAAPAGVLAEIDGDAVLLVEGESAERAAGRVGEAVAARASRPSS
ncbi:MAG: Sulfate adenylyltransferase subunit 1 [Labilithrix sp.]|nr:Sulfate adenylyltransferase subunit 1 [Labilithrix sp.]